MTVHHSDSPLAIYFCVLEQICYLFFLLPCTCSRYCLVSFYKVWQGHAIILHDNVIWYPETHVKGSDVCTKDRHNYFVIFQTCST